MSERATGADRLAAELRQRVLSGDLEPGAPLREEALADEYALSRHTVRRSLERLVAERLLVSEAYRGVRVASFSDADIVALQQLRTALETEAVRLIRADHGDSWPVELLTPLFEAADRMAAEASPEHAHSAFHRALVATAGSPRITEAYERLDTEMLLFLRQLRSAYDGAQLCAEHRDYLSEVQRLGADAARQHLAASTAMLLSLRA
ncbi:GntR family transcriptional regulator [Aeromicrobium ginsengisoli]|uniref:GntR family transcriptional regulator n=1 Tax=Aeromicrobium ginsengisoli TaxID=363867 RepID=A0A5M4FIZ7_9ACTN|nr:GntR family transcriptional regulator [Aeromicrobium ginsengisoli]KAA1400117.1 GntR family transcriptional regulator [Aeromicrobium ginsengisoli]